MVQALFHVAYCNSMFYGITDGLMSQLQSVQNAAARLVSGARRYGYDNITPVLQELQWLPVRRPVDFKVTTMVYNHVTVRNGCSLPGRRLSAGLRRRSSSAAFYQLKDMCR